MNILTVTFVFIFVPPTYVHFIGTSECILHILNVCVRWSIVCSIAVVIVGPLLQILKLLALTSNISMILQHANNILLVGFEMVKWVRINQNDLLNL